MDWHWWKISAGADYWKFGIHMLFKKWKIRGGCKRDLPRGIGLYTFYENSWFHGIKLLYFFTLKWRRKSYMKIVMVFMEGLGWKIKYLLI